GGARGGGRWRSGATASMDASRRTRSAPRSARRARARPTPGRREWQARLRRRRRPPPAAPPRSRQWAPPLAQVRAEQSRGLPRFFEQAEVPRGGELDTLRRRDRPDDELRAAPESGQLLAADHHERGGLDRA